jgi:hypothetical protein
VDEFANVPGQVIMPENKQKELVSKFEDRVKRETICTVVFLKRKRNILI